MGVQTWRNRGRGEEKKRGEREEKRKKGGKQGKKRGGDKRKEDTFMFYCERRRGREKFISIVKMGTAR